MFYRLSVVPIEVPPLNKRVDDINDLIEHFLRLLTKDLSSFNLKLSSETLAIFQIYDWPGNIRQLKNILEWLVIMYGNQRDFLIKPSHLPPEILGYSPIIKNDTKSFVFGWLGSDSTILKESFLTLSDKIHLKASCLVFVFTFLK